MKASNKKKVSLSIFFALLLMCALIFNWLINDLTDGVPTYGDENLLQGFSSISISAEIDQSLDEGNKIPFSVADANEAIVNTCKKSLVSQRAGLGKKEKFEGVEVYLSEKQPNLSEKPMNIHLAFSLVPVRVRGNFPEESYEVTYNFQRTNFAYALIDKGFPVKGYNASFLESFFLESKNSIRDALNYAGVFSLEDRKVYPQKIEPFVFKVSRDNYTQPLIDRVEEICDVLADIMRPHVDVAREIEHDLLNALGKE